MPKQVCLPRVLRSRGKRRLSRIRKQSNQCKVMDHAVNCAQDQRAVPTGADEDMRPRR